MGLNQDATLTPPRPFCIGPFLETWQVNQGLAIEAKDNLHIKQPNAHYSSTPLCRPAPRTPSDRRNRPRLCRLIWKILHEGIRYGERGPAVSEEGTGRKMIRAPGSLFYRVEPAPAAPTACEISDLAHRTAMNAIGRASRAHDV